MKAVRKLPDILEALEDRGIDPEDVVVDRRAIRVITPNEEDESDLTEEEQVGSWPPSQVIVYSRLGGHRHPDLSPFLYQLQ